MGGSGLKRIFTALLGIPIIMLPMYMGGLWFTGLVVIIAVAAQFELYQLQVRASWNPNVILGLMISVLLVLRHEIDMALHGVLLLALFVFILSLRKGPEGNPLAQIGGTFTGTVYPALFLSFLPVMRNGMEFNLGAEAAFGVTLMMFALIWICDSCAYYVGSAIGKTPLAQTISPNKTVEGALGGVAGALIAVMAARFLFFPFLTWTDVLAFGLIAAVIGQMGDLFESLLKRSVNVKDSGTLLPGHGGFLDRFDSLALATPAYYLYLVTATNYL